MLFYRTPYLQYCPIMLQKAVWPIHAQPTEKRPRAPTLFTLTDAHTSQHGTYTYRHTGTHTEMWDHAGTIWIHAFTRWKITIQADRFFVPINIIPSRLIACERVFARLQVHDSVEVKGKPPLTTLHGTHWFHIACHIWNTMIVARLHLWGLIHNSNVMTEFEWQL